MWKQRGNPFCLTVLGALVFALVSPVPGAYAGLDSLSDNLPSRAAARRGEVVRAAFTTSVVDREPLGTISRLTTDHRKVYYFTELANMSGRRIIHRWEYKGKIMAEIPFEVRGPRWRVYSQKTLLPTWTGEWTASTVDEDGRVLALNTLEYEPIESSRPAFPHP